MPGCKGVVPNNPIGAWTCFMAFVLDYFVAGCRDFLAFTAPDQEIVQHLTTT